MSQPATTARGGVASARNLIAALAGLILVGAILLSQPSMAAPGGGETGFQAFFTSVSAVCGCALTTASPATRFNLAGEIVLALLIQAGGLVYAFVGARIVWRILRGVGDERDVDDKPGNLAGVVVVGTLGLEVLGAVAMWPCWHEPMGILDRTGLSLFHAVSAFCNSGMSVLPESLADYRYSPLTHVVAAPLMILGALGFPVLAELGCCRRSDPMQKRGLRRGARWIITVYAVLYLAGVVGVGAAQLVPRLYQSLKLGNEPNQPTYEPLTPSRLGATLADASFLSISSRSGGFTVMPMDDLRTGARFVLIPLMLVGGGAGGTAGGMGLLVLAVLVIGARRCGRGPNVARGEIAAGVVRAALSVGLACIAIYIVGVYLLCLSEPYPFQKLAFEASSALGGCGLSMGITGDLTTFGQGVILVMIFVGRVGPLVVLNGAVEGDAG